MTREQMIEIIMAMDDEDFRAFKRGLNQVTAEFGWGGKLDDAEWMDKLWHEDI